MRQVLAFMGKERLSRGEAKHRRRVLSEQRRATRVPYAEQIVQSRILDTGRIGEIAGKLGRDSLTPEARAELTVEGFWLEFKLGIIGQAERMSKIDRFLNQLELEEPKAYIWLTEVVGEDLRHREVTRISEIVRRVMSNP